MFASSKSPRLPRRREARGSDWSIWHQALQFVEEVLDDDEPLAFVTQSCRARKSSHEEPLIVGRDVVEVAAPTEPTESVFRPNSEERLFLNNPEPRIRLNFSCGPI